MSKDLLICISTFINNDQNIKILETNLKNIYNNIKCSFDISIFNDSYDKKYLIEDLIKKNDFKNCDVINTQIKGTAYCFIFDYIYTINKEYHYYLNIHDSIYINKNIPLEFNNDIYLLWSCTLNVIPSNILHYNELIKFVEKHNLSNYGEDFIKYISQDNYNMSFGQTFLMTKIHIDKINEVYNIKNILKSELNRRDRISLESIIGYAIYNLGFNIKYIDKSWYSGHLIMKDNDGCRKWIFEYFTKITLGR